MITESKKAALCETSLRVEEALFTNTIVVPATVVRVAGAKLLSLMSIYFAGRLPPGKSVMSFSLSQEIHKKIEAMKKINNAGICFFILPLKLGM